MINRDIDTDQIFCEFGKGDIIIGDPVIIKDGIIAIPLKNSEIKYKIGELVYTNDSKEETLRDLQTADMLFTFKSSKELDVIIAQLDKVRKRLEAKERIQLTIASFRVSETKE